MTMQEFARDEWACATPALARMVRLNSQPAKLEIAGR